MRYLPRAHHELPAHASGKSRRKSLAIHVGGAKALLRSTILPKHRKKIHKSPMDSRKTSSLSNRKRGKIKLGSISARRLDPPRRVNGRGLRQVVHTPNTPCTCFRTPLEQAQQPKPRPHKGSPQRDTRFMVESLRLTHSPISQSLSLHP